QRRENGPQRGQPQQPRREGAAGFARTPHVIARARARTLRVAAAHGVDNFAERTRISKWLRPSARCSSRISSVPIWRPAGSAAAAASSIARMVAETPALFSAEPVSHTTSPSARTLSIRHEAGTRAWKRSRRLANDAGVVARVGFDAAALAAS